LQAAEAGLSNDRDSAAQGDCDTALTEIEEADRVSRCDDAGALGAAKQIGLQARSGRGDRGTDPDDNPGRVEDHRGDRVGVHRIEVPGDDRLAGGGSRRALIIEQTSAAAVVGSPSPGSTQGRKGDRIGVGDACGQTEHPRRMVTARITPVMQAGRITRFLRINMRTLQRELDGAEALELAERFVVIFVIVPFLV
jgi:hypothetical protein